MTDKKFSEFVAKPTPLSTDEVVGYSGTDNIRIPVSSLTGEAGTITSVDGTAPISVDNTTDPAVPVVSISNATTSVDGAMSSADKIRLDSLPNSPVTGVTGVSPIEVDITDPVAPAISIDAATTSLPGSMSAADKEKLDGFSPENVAGWVAQFPEGRPILIAGTGQSNGNGWGIATAYESNSNVKDWSTDGTTAYPTPQPARAWRTPDTNGSDPKNDYSPLINYIGYKGGDIGNINISMANYIANSTGRTVYVVQVNRDGADVSFWNPSSLVTGADTGITLSSEVTAALATTEITTWNNANPTAQITAPDVLSIMQGEADAGGLLGLNPPATAKSVSPDVWGNTWLGYIKDSLSTYFKENHTRVIAYDIGQTYNWQEPRSANMTSNDFTPWRWNGVSSFVESGGNFFSFISSVGIEDQPWNVPAGTNPFTNTDAGQAFSGDGPIHFTGAGSNMQGELGAKLLLGEIGETATENDGWDILEGDQSDDDLGMPYTLRNQNRTTYEDDGTTVARKAGAIDLDTSTCKVTTLAAPKRAHGSWFMQPPLHEFFLEGSASSTDDAWSLIMEIELPNTYESTDRYSGIATLESLSTVTEISTVQQFALNVYPINITTPFVIQLTAGTLSAPFGIGGSFQTPQNGQEYAKAFSPGATGQTLGTPDKTEAAVTDAPYLVITATEDSLDVYVRGALGTSGLIKHRLRYQFNELSGL